MVREQERRIEKYKNKIDSDVIKDRYDKIKKEAVRLEKKFFGDAVRIEQEVKQMLPSASAFEIIYYIIFAKEINKIKEKHSSETLIKELEILQDKWYTRGLDLNSLNTIKTYYVPSYKLVVCITARFDVGKFDVDCFG